MPDIHARCTRCRRDFEGCTCTGVTGRLAVLAAGPITEPGLYNLTAAEYHADPVPGGSLSSSGARTILDCPAHFRYEQDHPQPPKKTFDLGHAAHRLVLGDGPELVRIDADEWRTAAVKAEVAEARARGAVPLKPAEWEQVHAMVAALLQHPVAARLFEPGTGTAESAGFWRDDRTSVMRRVLWDWRPNPRPGRMVIPDYKTCRSARPADLERAMHEYGYHQQADWYRAGAQALGLAGPDAEFLFVCQEKTPPYIVTVFQPDAQAMRIGAARNLRALETYAECVASRNWPGYTTDIAYLPLPPWAEKRDTEEYAL